MVVLLQRRIPVCPIGQTSSTFLRQLECLEITSVYLSRSAWLDALKSSATMKCGSLKLSGSRRRTAQAMSGMRFCDACWRSSWSIAYRWPTWISRSSLRYNLMPVRASRPTVFSSVCNLISYASPYAKGLWTEVKRHLMMFHLSCSALLTSIRRSSSRRRRRCSHCDVEV